MMSVFRGNGHYAAHVALRLRPLLGCLGEESFDCAFSVVGFRLLCHPDKRQ